jgi:hypothetical protein
MRLARKTKVSTKRRSKEAVRIMPDSREICSQTPAGRAEYARRREERWRLDKGICCLCGLPVALEYATVEHPDGRGLGGSRHDDRIESIRISHFFGNAKKGSVRLEKYLEFPLEVRVENCRGDGA